MTQIILHFYDYIMLLNKVKHKQIETHLITDIYIFNSFYLDIYLLPAHSSSITCTFLQVLPLSSSAYG